jgi:hypothetical protein
MMKRWVVLLGLLGLVGAAALPSASAAVLYQDDFSTDKLLKDAATYIQGVGSGILNGSTILPFYVREGELWSSPEGSTLGSDNVVDGADPETTARYLLLFGDPNWADVAIQS